jgi:hypothetical protein
MGLTDILFYVFAVATLLFGALVQRARRVLYREVSRDKLLFGGRLRRERGLFVSILSGGEFGRFRRRRNL